MRFAERLIWIGASRRTSAHLRVSASGVVLEAVFSPCEADGSANETTESIARRGNREGAMRYVFSVLAACDASRGRVFNTTIPTGRSGWSITACPRPGACIAAFRRRSLRQRRCGSLSLLRRRWRRCLRSCIGRRSPASGTRRSGRWARPSAGRCDRRAGARRHGTDDRHCRVDRRRAVESFAASSTSTEAS